MATKLKRALRIRPEHRRIENIQGTKTDLGPATGHSHYISILNSQVYHSVKTKPTAKDVEWAIDVSGQQWRYKLVVYAMRP